MQIGDICIASASVQHDMDCSPIFPRFEIPLTQITRFPTQEWLVEHAQKAARVFFESKIQKFISKTDLEKFGITQPKVHVGLLGSGDQFMKNDAVLENLRHALPDLLFVEMEGAAIAQVCWNFHIPLLNIRTISDHADHDAFFDFNLFVQKITSPYVLGVLSEIIVLV